MPYPYSNKLNYKSFFVGFKYVKTESELDLWTEGFDVFLMFLAVGVIHAREFCSLKN